MKELKTKSQIILRIAELSEQNALLRDELYKKSETEQALQTALEENAELKDKVDLLDRLTDELHDRHMTLAETYQETRNTCKKLIQESEELRKTVESQKGLITVGGKQQYKYLQEIDKLQQENKENIHYLACMTEQRNKLKFALEEIRGLAKTITDDFEEMDFEQQKHYCDEISNNIVNKINEVLNESK